MSWLLPTSLSGGPGLDVEYLPGGWARVEASRPPRHRYAIGVTASAAIAAFDAGHALDKLLDTLGIGPAGDGAAL